MMFACPDSPEAVRQGERYGRPLEEGNGRRALYFPIIFLAWQSLSFVSQAAVHCLKRASQSAESLPRDLHIILEVLHASTHPLCFSVHLSAVAANTIITPLESARTATHILRFIPRLWPNSRTRPAKESFLGGRRDC
jgi:hypothetical protein